MGETGAGKGSAPVQPQPNIQAEKMNREDAKARSPDPIHKDRKFFIFERFVFALLSRRTLHFRQNFASLGFASGCLLNKILFSQFLATSRLPCSFLRRGLVAQKARMIPDWLIGMNCPFPMYCNSMAALRPPNKYPDVPEVVAAMVAGAEV